MLPYVPMGPSSYYRVEKNSDFGCGFLNEQIHGIHCLRMRGKYYFSNHIFACHRGNN